MALTVCTVMELEVVTETVTETVAEEAREEPKPDPDDESKAYGPTIPGDGLYRVSGDVEPGTYTTQPGS